MLSTYYPDNGNISSSTRTKVKPYEELEPAIWRGINASIAKLDGLQWNFRIETIYKVSYNVSQNRVILDVQIDLLCSLGWNKIALDGQLENISDEFATFGADQLNWTNPIASQVLNDHSPYVKSLTRLACEQFMESLEYMKPKLLSEIITKCIKFALEYKNWCYDKFCNFKLNFVHGKSWKDGILKQKKSWQ
ncbi:777_t:CDS:2 [Gigaspora margarita]|uniref:777_t:CDS:1 n=1 Tax=Gigaspora margarita TaxID=4874 RepID=A0ABN7UDQ0_GIGMA|nr:777_t:CDS:2 [Gigaspora margarita]